MPTTADKKLLCCRIVFKSSLLFCKNTFGFMFSVRGFWFVIYECQTPPRNFIKNMLCFSDIEIWNLCHEFSSFLTKSASDRFWNKVGLKSYPKKIPEKHNLQWKIKMDFSPFPTALCYDKSFDEKILIRCFMINNCVKC